MMTAGDLTQLQALMIAFRGAQI